MVNVVVSATASGVSFQDYIYLVAITHNQKSVQFHCSFSCFLPFLLLPPLTCVRVPMVHHTAFWWLLLFNLLMQSITTMMPKMIKLLTWFSYSVFFAWGFKCRGRNTEYNCCIVVIESKVPLSSSSDSVSSSLDGSYSDTLSDSADLIFIEPNVVWPTCCSLACVDDFLAQGIWGNLCHKQ